jgi:hypothetical protein
MTNSLPTTECDSLVGVPQSRAVAVAELAAVFGRRCGSVRSIVFNNKLSQSDSISY